jgi:hypothetical protein
LNQLSTLLLPFLLFSLPPRGDGPPLRPPLQKVPCSCGSYQLLAINRGKGMDKKYPAAATPATMAFPPFLLSDLLKGTLLLLSLLYFAALKSAFSIQNSLIQHSKGTLLLLPLLQNNWPEKPIAERLAVALRYEPSSQRAFFYHF